MASFTYRAIDSLSATHRGQMSAPTINDLENTLASQGLTLIEAENASFLNFGDFFGITFSPKDLVDFTYMLKLVVSSGIPILTGIHDLMKGHANRKVLHASQLIYQGLDSGLSLSEVMGANPKIFPGFYVHMVKAGEVSGTLDASLDFLMNYLNWQIEFRKTVRGALAYPITILSVMGILMVIIFTVVFPKLLKLLTGLGAEMPLPTKIMVAISTVMREYFLYIAGFSVIMFIVIQIFKRTPRGREFIDSLILKLPVIGSLVRKINLSRYFKIIATLHASGVNVERTFIIGAEVVGNTILSQKLATIASAIVTGDSISESMRRTGFIDDLMVDMVSLAEKTGKLEEALARGSDILDREVPETIKRLVSLIEPITMMLLGGLVLLLLLSVFLPIYKVVGQMKIK